LRNTGLEVLVGGLGIVGSPEVVVGSRIVVGSVEEVVGDLGEEMEQKELAHIFLMFST
jgi:hypothetical protein